MKKKKPTPVPSRQMTEEDQHSSGWKLIRTEPRWLDADGKPTSGYAGSVPSVKGFVDLGVVLEDGSTQILWHANPDANVDEWFMGNVATCLIEEHLFFQTMWSEHHGLEKLLDAQQESIKNLKSALKELEESHKTLEALRELMG